METIMNYKGANANKSGMFRVNVPVVNEVDGELVNNNVIGIAKFIDTDTVEVKTISGNNTYKADKITFFNPFTKN